MEIKNKENILNSTNSREGGFFKLIILIIIALLLMKYFNISVSDIINWFKTLFGSVLK